MHRAARSLSALGLGLSVSAIVGWLLLRESKRVKELSTLTVRSRSHDADIEAMPPIVLPMDHTESNEATVDTDGDDLTQIEGIGRTFAEALHSIGIRRFEQLAAQSPESLAEQLAGHTTVTAQRIRNKDWIGQAKRRAKA